jgi:hypothetical protein
MASEDHDLGAQDAAIASLAVERCARSGAGIAIET